MAILLSVGPDSKKIDKPFSVAEKFQIANDWITDKGEALWGVRFPLNKNSIIRKGGVFPIKGMFYVKKNSYFIPKTRRGFISYEVIIQDVESYKKPQTPSDPNLRPIQWRENFFRTYLRLSSKIEPIIPIQISEIRKWDGMILKGTSSVQGYVLVRSYE